MMLRIPRAAPALVALAAFCLGGCGASSTTVRPGGTGVVVSVLAAENFWGSIAQQLGGRHADVSSVVTDPNADPHEYQSTIRTARAFAGAGYVILNGAGYDSWAQRELGAATVAGRRVLVVADLLHRRAGANPHFWYNPADVVRVAARITGDLQRIDPVDAPYFAERYAAFQRALTPYHRAIALIRDRYRHVPVGATESVFVYLAAALGLDLVSPPAFMQAVSEGNDPPISSVAQMEEQITGHQVRVLVYNTQTATQVTTTMKDLAVRAHIPTVGITEIMQPASTTFQRWQTSQLRALVSALAGARSGAAR